MSDPVTPTQSNNVQTAAVLGLGGFGLLAALMLLGSSLFSGCGKTTPPTQIIYQQQPQPTVVYVQSPAQTPAQAATPSLPPLFQGGTVVHHHAPEPAATPVQFVSNGFRSSKQDAWNHENGGFQISSPANGRDAVNANSTANAWRAQQNVSEQRSQEAAAKETPPRIVTKTVTVPVVKTVTVPVYVDRTVYVHPRYWYSPACPQ